MITCTGFAIECSVRSSLFKYVSVYTELLYRTGTRDRNNKYYHVSAYVYVKVGSYCCGETHQFQLYQAKMPSSENIEYSA